MVDFAAGIAEDPRLATWRDDTPGCRERIHLNNCGAALMPRPVTDAIVEHLRLEERIGGYEAADERKTAIDRVYPEIAAWLGCLPHNVAVVANATDGFVRALSAFDFSLGGTIITTRCDYTSNQIQYLSLARRLGVRVERAEDLPEGGVDPQSVRELLRRARGRRVVAATWIPTNSGLVQDLDAVGAVCQEIGAHYLVDACQAAGQMPINVLRLQCDYLSVTARKFLRGPRGIGFLYVSDHALERGEHPLFVDMRGAKWTAPDAYELADDARRFEDWEFPYALVLGLGAATRYARAVGTRTAQERAWGLAAYARRRLAEIPGVRVLDRGSVKCAIVTFDRPGLDAEQIVSRLTQRGINTSVSLAWYGLLDMAEKGTAAAVRVSPHYYNTAAEIDALVATVMESAAA
jgi:selenocysteine lyase/cysteine desulfurase